MLKRLFIGLLFAFIILLIVIALQPSESRIERSLVIDAAPSVVFAQINDFRKWDAWSPWAKMDPNMQITHSGSTTGTGATYAWVGDPQLVGSGRMEIVESTANQLVRIAMEFLIPFPSTSTADFLLEQQDGGTKVTWSMYGPQTFMAKAVGLVIDMDTMLGAQFEEGLAAMKTIAESN